MRHADRQRWATALAAARKRWNAGESRSALTAELDALWDELHGQSSGQSLDKAPDNGAGPRHVALGALLAGIGSPGAGCDDRR